MVQENKRHAFDIELMVTINVIITVKNMMTNDKHNTKKKLNETLNNVTSSKLWSVDALQFLY